jgi:hypothetical protein
MNTPSKGDVDLKKPHIHDLEQRLIPRARIMGPLTNSLVSSNYHLVKAVDGDLMRNVFSRYIDRYTYTNA